MTRPRCDRKRDKKSVSYGKRRGPGNVYDKGDGSYGRDDRTKKSEIQSSVSRRKVSLEILYGYYECLARQISVVS